MDIANPEIIDPRTDPMSVFEEILSRIFEQKDELGIPMKKFAAAPAKLKRLGVTFLVILEKFGKEELVPFRVDNTRVLYTRFCSKEDLASWRGRYIHPV